MYQRQFQKIQPQTTAHLAQTMTLLNMNLGELNQEINRALNENPALVVKEERRCPTCNYILHEGQICPICTRPRSSAENESIVFISPRGEFVPKNSTSEDEIFTDENMGSEEISLEEYVLRQVVSDLEEKERIIAAYILNQLDEDGFFKEDISEVASYYHVSVSTIEAIKRIIQKADPIGIASASPEEAIKVQLDELRENGEVPETYLEIADRYLHQLLKKQYKEISQELGIPIQEVIGAADYFGKNLNPYPTRAHWGTFRQPAAEENKVYSNPDVIISHLNNDPAQPLLVEVIIPYISFLNINPLYTQAIKEANEETRNELRSDYEKANLFIKCLQQRNNTMQRLLERISRLQKEYILKGEKYIQPLTRAQIAQELKVHESTISRAVSSKSVQLPDGRIIPMSLFFDRSLGIRAEIKEIIAEEKKDDPLSDSEIVKILSKKGFDLARRTVAKYRLMEGILPAHQRRNQKR
ncbi:MAG: RNA polymerase factor sigma-54 [Pelolinea sp.]|nr:RNA polymerase factor sigma-54 [Pelolinea sp.]